MGDKTGNLVAYGIIVQPTEAPAGTKLISFNNERTRGLSGEA